VIWEAPMKLARRPFLRMAAGVAVLPAIPVRAWSQAYPARPIHLIVGQAAGSSSDMTARLIGQWLSDRLGQQVIVEARPGAGGNIATEAVVRSPTDGYTLLLVNSQNAINASLYSKLSFNFIRDIAPVACLFRVPLVMEVIASFPAKSVPEFIAYAKANPGQVNMASAGIGGPQHVAGELFKSMAGVDLVHVPYRGTTPALTDLLAGQMQLMFDVTPSSLPHIRAGKLRPLAVTSATAIEVLPDVPTVDQFLPGYEASGWLGFGVPKGTPAAVVETLNREINAANLDPRIRKQLTEQGAMMLPPGPPADFARLIAEETEKWAAVIRLAGIKAD
jgi:tripartite-type tricarboxylate transporter receptor subunit TctC